MLLIDPRASIDAAGLAEVSKGEGTGGVARATGEEVAARNGEGRAAAPPVGFAAVMPSSRRSLIFGQPFLSAPFSETKVIARVR